MTQEKDSTIMDLDLIHKLEDTNHSITMVRGLIEGQGHDIKTIKGKSGVTDFRLDGIESRLARMENLLYVQGQDIRDMKRQLIALDEKLNLILRALTPHTTEK